MAWSLSSPEFPAEEVAAERTQGSSWGSTPIGAGIKGEADTGHHRPTCPQDEVQQPYRLPGDICLWIPDALGCGRCSQTWVELSQAIRRYQSQWRLSVGITSSFSSGGRPWSPLSNGLWPLISSMSLRTSTKRVSVHPEISPCISYFYFSIAPSLLFFFPSVTLFWSLSVLVFQIVLCFSSCVFVAVVNGHSISVCWEANSTFYLLLSWSVLLCLISNEWPLLLSLSLSASLPASPGPGIRDHELYSALPGADLYRHAIADWEIFKTSVRWLMSHW